MKLFNMQEKVIQIKKEHNSIGEINNNPESTVKSDYDVFKINEITVIQILIRNARLIDSKIFKLSIDELIDNGNKKIIVDLRKCKMIDSSFWGVLIYAQRKIHNLNGSIRIVFETHKQSALAIASGLDKIFKMYEDISQAFDSFKNKPLGQTLEDIVDFI